MGIPVSLKLKRVAQLHRSFVGEVRGYTVDIAEDLEVG